MLVQRDIGMCSRKEVGIWAGTRENERGVVKYVPDQLRFRSG